MEKRQKVDDETRSRQVSSLYGYNCISDTWKLKYTHNVTMHFENNFISLSVLKPSQRSIKNLNNFISKLISLILIHFEKKCLGFY